MEPTGSSRKCTSERLPRLNQALADRWRKRPGRHVAGSACREAAAAEAVRRVEGPRTYFAISISQPLISIPE